MILQALYQLAQREGLMREPDFEPRPVAWLVRVGEKGQLLGIEGTHYTPPLEGKKKPKALTKVFGVPKQPTGRSGTKAPPCFLVDNAKYVFGLSTKDKDFPAEEGREKSASFRDMVWRCSEETKDDAASAVLALLENVASGRTVVDLPSECVSNDLFAFIYSPDVDRLVHDRPKVREYWKQLRRVPVPANNARYRCLVSGEPLAEIGLFRLIEKVPGARPSQIALVSFNPPATSCAFSSYGWKGNENAPISRNAAEACSTALNRLLHPAYTDPSGQTLPRRNLHLSANTAVCFWSAEESGDEFCSVFAGLLEADPENVKELYQSIWRGKHLEIERPTSFYALTLTGTQGRAIIRDWFESTVTDVARNLAGHFADLDVVRNTPKPKNHDLPAQMPLSLLLEALAPRGDSKEIPAPYIAQILRAALHGTPYPFSILERSLERTRAEIGNTEWKALDRRDARAALIKAVLNRRKRFFPQTTNYQEVRRDMDPNNGSKGYTLGRLMAVLERIQHEALGGVNASVVDRYFSGASATPKSVFVRLLKNARHHVSKAKDDPAKGGIIFLLDRLVDDLADPFDPKQNGFPAHLDLEQQGLFVLGYHQMRKWLWMNKEERILWEKDHSTAPRAYLWSAQN